MPLTLDRSHAAATIIRSVTWDFDNGRYVMDRPVPGQGFQKVPVTQPFLIDIHQAQHGWEQFLGGKVYTPMAAVSSPIPEKPDGKAKPCYTVPINSEELGGTRTLVLMGQGVTANFADWFEAIAKELADIDDIVVPYVSVVGKNTREWGWVPVFTTEDYIPRPDAWLPPIVNFKT